MPEVTPAMVCGACYGLAAGLVFYFYGRSLIDRFLPIDGLRQDLVESEAELKSCQLIQYGPDWEGFQDDDRVLRRLPADHADNARGAAGSGPLGLLGLWRSAVNPSLRA